MACPPYMSLQMLESGRVALKHSWTPHHPTMSTFLPFGEALAVARSLGLATRKEWKAWCKAGMRPPEVPADPSKTYKGGGWQGWGHWLGTGNKSNRERQFLPFTDALAMARSLGLTSLQAWQAWCKEGACPPDVPAAPDRVYVHAGWQGWGHWLGTGNTHGGNNRVAKPAAIAAAATTTTTTKTTTTTTTTTTATQGPVRRATPRKPTTTDQICKDTGLGHWTGHDELAQASRFAAFGQALAFARALRLTGVEEWQAWCAEGRRPPNVPTRPDRVYMDAGWQGWGHWLGTSNKPTEQFLPFEEALAVARSVGLASNTEWHAWCKEGRRPRNVPTAPNATYKDGGWQGWGHWLGTGNKMSGAKAFLPFGEALAAARSLNLGRRTEWKQWCKEGMRPTNVPSNPQATYKDCGWQGWGHWLGTGNRMSGAKAFLPFGEALAVARSLRLANQKEWDMWCRSGMRPPSVPSHPQRTYKDGGWQGWGHWLGTGNVKGGKKQFLPFEEALAVARSLRLATQKEWEVWCRRGMRPPNVPSHPQRTFKDGGWVGWGHWLQHADVGTEAAGAATHPGTKRAAAGCTGTLSGKRSGKRRR